MTIAFPEGVAERIETIARQKGYPSAAEYLMELVEESEANTSGPPELSPKTRDELEAMLGAGMNSGPPIRATPEFWEQRRKALEERMAKRKEGSP